MAALRAGSLRMESGIWFFTKRFGVGLAFGFSLTDSDCSMNETNKLTQEEMRRGSAYCFFLRFPYFFSSFFNTIGGPQLSATKIKIP